MHEITWRGLTATLVLLTCLLNLAACNTLGPRAVRHAGVHYTAAVAQSWDEQLLANLVRLRYGQAPLFMEVTSLSTQYNLAAGVHFEPLWTRPEQTIKEGTSTATGLVTSRKQVVSDDEYSHSLGVDYYERPTVTYIPLRGQAFITSLLSPIGIDDVLLLTSSGWSIERIFVLCAQRINELSNAPSASGPTPRDEPRFQGYREAVRLLRELQVRGELWIDVRNKDGGNYPYLELSESAKEGPLLERMRESFGLPSEERAWPVHSVWASRRPGELAIQTRSLLGVLYFLCNSVEIPEAHLQRGWAVQTKGANESAFDWRDVTGDWLRVRTSKSAPADAVVKIRYEGHWFYIAKDDVSSKYTFTFLAALFALQAGEVPRVSPALTIPVG